MWEDYKYSIFSKKNEKIKNLKNGEKSGPEPPFIHTTQVEWPSLRLAFWDLLHLVSKTITLTKTSAS